MKSNKFVSIVLVTMIFLVMMLTSRTVLAANNVNITVLDGNSITKSNNTTSSSSSSGNNTTSNNVATINNTTNTLTTTNTSNYNNTNLPKTGVEDTFPGIVLIIVLGISAIYAYKKIQYYKNI